MILAAEFHQKQMEDMKSYDKGICHSILIYEIVPGAIYEYQLSLR